jgi:hypothetical protein
MAKPKAYLVESARIGLPLCIIAGGVAAMFVLWGLKKPPAVAVPPPDVNYVATAGVEAHGESMDLVTDGLVAPARDVTVATQVAGKVTYKSPLCEAGKYVPQGTVLFKIDQQDYALELERLTKERAQADATLQEIDLELQNTESLIALAQEDVNLQQRELQRQLQLRGAAVSPSAIDQARRAELAARNALQTLENQKRLLQTRRTTNEIARDLVEVRLEKAQLDLDRTEVKAAVSGVIVEEMVEEDSFVPIGAALAKIEDTSSVEVRCSLQMDELYWLWRQHSAPDESPYRHAGFSIEETPPSDDASEGEPPQPVGHTAYQIPRADVTVIYEVGGRRFAWEGVLDRFEGIGIDERTRTVPCRVVVPEPREVQRLDANGGGSPAVGPQALVRGMFVRLRIHVQPDAALVRVPEQAIRPGGKVWVVRQGKLQIVPVEVATVVDGNAILDGEAWRLHPGDRVVVTPLALAQDGMEVVEQR